MTPIHWTVTMLAVVAALYAGAAAAYQYSDRPGMAVAFVGYIIANLGLIIDAVQK